MKHLRKFENKDEIDENLEIVKGALDFYSEYDELEIHEITEMIDELMKSSKDEIREIHESIQGNRYDGNLEHAKQKNDCMLGLISKYCSIIWS